MAIITKISLILALAFLVSNANATLKCYKCSPGDKCNTLASDAKAEECGTDEKVCYIKGVEKDEKWSRGCAVSEKAACPEDYKDACSTCSTDECNAATIPGSSAILCILTVAAYNLLR